MRSLRYLLVIGVVVAAALSARPSYAGDDLTPPICGVDDFSSYTTFYPSVDGYRDRVSMDYSVSDDFAGDIGVVMWIILPDGSGTIVRGEFDTPASVSNPGSGTAVWDGRDDTGALVPEGDYLFTLQVTDAAGNISNECQQQVTVDHAQLVKRTFKKTVRAAPSKVDQFVGRCSTLRKPSLRGWTGSLGLYSNTKCNRTGTPSVVVSIHAEFVPQAIQNRYHRLTIKLYGGAATSRPGSKSILQYVDKTDDPRLAKVMGSSVGTHSGVETDNAKAFIRDDGHGNRYVAWGLAVASGNRYDVRDYTIVLRYTKLV